MKRWLLLVLVAAGPAFAQPRAILLVAKPGLPDPNFRETVVLVTRAEATNVGVVLNRPTPMQLAQLTPRWPRAERYTEPLYAGGPVMQQVVVALFASETVPPAPAFHVLPRIYLSMHPDNIEPLLERPGAMVRLFAGFSGWAPSQLEAEIEAGGWYVLRVDEDLLFRKDTTGLWTELVEKARGSRATRNAMSYVAVHERAARRPFAILVP